MQTNIAWIAASLLGAAWALMPQEPAPGGKDAPRQDRAVPRGVEVVVNVTSKDARPFDVQDFSATLILNRANGAKEELPLSYVAVAPPGLEAPAGEKDKDRGVMPARRLGQIREIEGTPYYAELILAPMKSGMKPDVKPESDPKPRQDDGRDRRQDPPVVKASGHFRAELPADDVDTLKFNGEIVFKIKNESRAARGYRWPFPGVSGQAPMYPKFDEDLAALETQVKAYDLASIPATVDRMLQAMPMGASDDKNGEMVALLKDVRSAAVDKKRDLTREAFTRLKRCCDGSKSPQGRAPDVSPDSAPGGSK